MPKKETIIYQAEPCTLWENTKVLAKDRGLEMADKCPLDSVCNGKGCLMTIRKENRLAKLREELKEIVKNDRESVIIGC